MAHFALVNDNTVSTVIVVSNEDCGGGNFPESEPIGQAFIASIGLPGEWMQTSYSSSFRGAYLGFSEWRKGTARRQGAAFGEERQWRGRPVMGGSPVATLCVFGLQVHGPSRSNYSPPRARGGRSQWVYSHRRSNPRLILKVLLAGIRYRGR